MNLKNSRFRRVLRMLLLAVGGLFLVPLAVFATSILDSPNASVPNVDDVASAKYSFIAKVTEKTKVTTFGTDKWKKLDSVYGSQPNSTYPKEYFTFNPQKGNTDLKGKIGVRYSNVGYYDQTELDLKVTVLDWDSFRTETGNISYAINQIAHNMQGYNWINQKWEFVKTGTDTPVKVSGFMTVNDVDAKQGIQFSKVTSAAIKKVYVSGTDNLVSFENINGDYKYFDGTGRYADPLDKDAMFTFMFEDSSDLTFKWGRNNVGDDKEASTDITIVDGEFFGYIAKKPIKTEILTPVKTVTDLDEKEVEKNALLTVGEKFSYTVRHTVLDEFEEFYYNQYAFDDTVSSLLEVASVSVKNELGKDVTSYFDNKSVGNVIKLTAKESTLKNADFYGHDYFYKIDVSLKKTVNLADLTAGVVVNNKASIGVDGESKVTNVTETTVPKPTVPVPVKKVVNAENGDINNKAVHEGEKFYYVVDQKVNTLDKDVLARYSLFKMVDVLDSKVSFVEAQLLKDGKVIADAKTISYDEKSHSVIFNADAAFLKSMTLTGETYSLKIGVTAKTKLLATDIIKNTASVQIDEVTKETNEVINPIEKPVIAKPDKTETNEKGEDINNKDVMAGDTIMYQVNQKVNVLGSDIFAKYHLFEMSDSLPKQVAFEKAVVKVDGKEVEGVKVIAYDETTHTVTFKADTVFLSGMKMAGEVITLEITTKVITEIAENEKIENDATVKINDHAAVTNKVVNKIKVPKGSININKVTDQLVGITTNVVDKEAVKVSLLSKIDSVLFETANADVDQPSSLLPELIWKEKAQKDVTFKLMANEDITFPNGELIAEKGTEYGEQTTGKGGKATFDNLYEGLYVLVEQSAPNGIQVDATPIIVPLKAENNGQEIVVADANQKDPLQEVLVKGHKVFETDKGEFEPSEGATFGLFYGKDYEIDKDNVIKKDTKIADMPVTKEGIFTYQGVMIPTMTYYVKELATKEGYQLTEKIFKFTYTPVSNAAVHMIELFENGFVENEVFQSYPLDVLVTEEQTETTSDTTSDSQSSSEKDIETTSSSKQSKVTEETSTSSTESTVDSSSSEDELTADTEKEAIKNWMIKENTGVKSILKDDGARVDQYDILKDGETIVFEGLFTIGDNKDLNALTLTDVLPEGFNILSVKVYNEQEEDMTKDGKVVVKGQEVTFTLSGDQAKALRRTKLRWVIETSYQHKTEFEGKEFTNQMTYTLNDQSFKTNTVVLTPPVIKAAVETPVVDKVLTLLPQTGEFIQKWYAVIGLALVLFSVAVVYTQKNKAKEEQNLVDKEDSL